NDKGEVVKEATRIEKNGIMHWPTYRIPGVLQRIAVCYLVVGLIALAGSWPLELLVAIGACVLYCLLMMLHPVSPTDSRPDLSERGNYAYYLDAKVFHRHVYRLDKDTGEPIGDPEGILSTLPAIATTLLGLLA